MTLREVLRDIPGLRWIYHRYKGLINFIKHLDYREELGVQAPNLVTIDFVRKTTSQVIAEIGVGRGRTSKELAEYLNNRGELHLFDFEDTVQEVVEKLDRAGYRNIIAHGNSRKTMDSYNWSLMRLLEQHERPIFDYVFLDGAHTWFHDALAFLVVDRLLKVGGYVDFDDYSWTIATSPTVNPMVFPRVKQRYTPEQINSQQVRLVIELLVRRDPRYQEVVQDKIFRKVGRGVIPE